MFDRDIYGEKLEVHLVGVVECPDILGIVEQQVSARTAQAHDASLVHIIRYFCPG